MSCNKVMVSFLGRASPSSSLEILPRISHSSPGFKSGNNWKCIQCCSDYPLCSLEESRQSLNFVDRTHLARTTVNIIIVTQAYLLS